MITEKNKPLLALTSLRFFAALAIVVHHCNGVFWKAAVLGPLDVGVSFFFVLSGFILTYVYADLPTGATARGQFYLARLARIWPLHLVCLLLTMALVAIPEPFSPGVLIANALLLHAWIPFDRYFFSYNYVSWSISTELFFYLVFPLLIVRARRWLKPVVLLTVITVLVLALASFQAHLLPWETTQDHLSSTGLLYTNPLARLAEFLMGMATAMVFRKTAAMGNGNQMLWTGIELITLGMFALGFRYFLLSFAPAIHEAMLSAGATTVPMMRLGEESAVLAQVSPFGNLLVSEWVDHVGLTPFAMVLIYVFAHQRGMVSVWLSQRWMVFLGEISFAVYLLHQIVIRFAQQHFGALYGTDFMLFLVAVLIGASALHLLIERPVRQWVTVLRKG